MGLDFPLNFQGLEKTIPPGMLGANLLQLLTSSPLAPTEKGGQVLRNIPSPTNPNIFAQQSQLRPALSFTTPSSHPLPYSRGNSKSTSSAHAEGGERPSQDKAGGESQGSSHQIPADPTNPRVHISRVNSNTHLPRLITGSFLPL